MTKSLLTFSVIMLLLNACLVYFEPLFQADAIAPKLAVRFEVEEAAMRNQLENTLHENWENRVILMCSPWLIMIVLLTVSEFSRANRRRNGNG